MTQNPQPLPGIFEKLLNKNTIEPKIVYPLDIFLHKTQHGFWYKSELPPPLELNAAIYVKVGKSKRHYYRFSLMSRRS
jgi:hypothetical protein